MKISWTQENSKCTLCVARDKTMRQIIAEKNINICMEGGFPENCANDYDSTMQINGIATN